MSSKKHRKKLRQQYYNLKDLKLSHEENKLIHDRDAIYNYLKEKPYTHVTSDVLIENCDLYHTNKTQISTIIKHVIKCYNVVIDSKRGRKGGYMYYEQS